jgi:hypothetical protein
MRLSSLSFFGDNLARSKENTVGKVKLGDEVELLSAQPRIALLRLLTSRRWWCTVVRLCAFSV